MLADEAEVLGRSIPDAIRNPPADAPAYVGRGGGNRPPPRLIVVWLGPR